jgi:hypothetical protein
MPWGEPEDPWAEALQRSADRLQVTLPSLVARRVPVRLLEPGPVTGVGRLRMADGTTFLVTAAVRGDLGRVVRAMIEKRTILCSGWERDSETLTITLEGVPGRHPVRLHCLPDQPD